MRLNSYLGIFRPNFTNLANPGGRSSYRYRRAAWTALSTGTARVVSIIAGSYVQLFAFASLYNLASTVFGIRGQRKYKLHALHL